MPMWPANWQRLLPRQSQAAPWRCRSLQREYPPTRSVRESQRRPRSASLPRVRPAAPGRQEALKDRLQRLGRQRTLRLVPRRRLSRRRLSRRWTSPWTASASVLLSALVAESRLAVASRSSEFFCAAWSATVASRDRVLSAAVADASSERRCNADCCWAVEVPRSLLLLVSADVLLSTSAPKLSFP